MYLLLLGSSSIFVLCKTSFSFAFKNVAVVVNLCCYVVVDVVVRNVGRIMNRLRLVVTSAIYTYICLVSTGNRVR